MANTVTEFNLSFVIQKSNERGHDLGCYKIDQYCSPRDGERGRQRVRNQVERHLFHQWRKTGITHSVIYEGDAVEAAGMVERYNSCPF